MIIKLSNGYEVEVEKEKVVDFEFTYLIGCLQDDSPEEALKDNALLLNKILGGKKEVMKLFAYMKKQNNNCVPNELASNILKEILEALGEKDKKK